MCSDVAVHRVLPRRLSGAVAKLLVLPGLHSAGLRLRDASGCPRVCHCAVLTPASVLLPFCPGCPRGLSLAKSSFPHSLLPQGPVQSSLGHSDPPPGPRPMPDPPPAPSSTSTAPPAPCQGLLPPPPHVFWGDGADLEGGPNPGGGWKNLCCSFQACQGCEGPDGEASVWSLPRAGRTPWRAAPLPRAPAGSWPSPDILHRSAQLCCSCCRAPAAASHAGWGSPHSQKPADPPGSIRLEAGTLPGAVPWDAGLAQPATRSLGPWCLGPRGEAFCQFAGAAEGRVPEEELAACAGAGLPHAKPAGGAGVPSCLPGPGRRAGAASWRYRAVPRDAGVAPALRRTGLTLHPGTL